jgi:anti-sigma-K factor RskA
MQLHRHPELLDRLAAAHALGTLRGGARRRFEALAREQASVRAAALLWQAHAASLTELQDSVAPPPELWTRIEQRIRAEQAWRTLKAPASPPPPRRWWQALAVWQGLTATGGLATAAAVALLMVSTGRHQESLRGLQAELAGAQQIRYVAVLQDDQAGPALLVTYDARGQRLQLQREGGYQEAPQRSLQLWALPPGGKPRSLGVLSRDRALSLGAREADVKGVPTLAVSLEPLGGVPSEGGPTGPVLFKGALIQKTS